MTGHEALNREDRFEGFDQTLIEFLKDDADSGVILGDWLMIDVNGSWAKDTASRMIAEGVFASNEIGQMKSLNCWNPANGGYFELTFNFKTGNNVVETDIEFVEMGLGANYIAVYRDSATEYVVEIYNGSTTSSANIAMTPEDGYHDYTIRIKSGQIDFLIDDVVMHSTTGDGLFFDIPNGMYAYLSIWNGNTTPQNFRIDSANVVIGKVF